LAWIGGFNDMAGNVFQAFKMTKSSTSEALYISTKILMTLEESHCKSTKRPNRGFVNARFLSVESHTTFEKSHYQAHKMRNRGSVINMGGEIHAS
jgi:hypothetical protein